MTEGGIAVPGAHAKNVSYNPDDDAPESDPNSDSDLDEDEEPEPFVANQKTCQEQMLERVELLEEFMQGLRYQIQFNDTRMLNKVEREGASLFCLAENCLDQEKRFNSVRMDAPTTYERQTSNAMFWRMYRNQFQETI
jgi:hypothetical protein